MDKTITKNRTNKFEVERQCVKSIKCRKKLILKKLKSNSHVGQED